ncbi:hypothetical protein B0H17DRAFT_1013209, partial [Mycena rosella]
MGVAIGDVGRITGDGIFDFFFNIYLPADHPINANTPKDFYPMPAYAAVDVFHLYHAPGNYVSAPSVQKVDLDQSTNVFPGGEFTFNCEAPRGAVLALPHGGHLEKLENLDPIREYAAQHAESWYRYINGARGRGLSNGSLYLATGREKSQSWGMASFNSVREEFQVTYKPTPGAGSLHNYRWRGIHARRNPARDKTYDSGAEGSRNQTTFIHGLSISLGTGIWGRLFGNVEISPIVDVQLGNNKGDFTASSSQGSPMFSWFFNFFGGRSTTGGKHYGNSGDEIVISNFPPVSKIFNPAEVINQHLLHRTQHANVVMSHDDDWCDILQDDGTSSVVQDPSEFLQRINDQFDVMDKYGATFLISKCAPNIWDKNTAVQLGIGSRPRYTGGQGGRGGNAYGG